MLCWRSGPRSSAVLYTYDNAQATFGVGQLGSSLYIFGIRGAAGIVSHALFSAIFCAGVMWILSRVTGERNVARGLLTCLVAMAFHFSWDDVSGLAFGNELLTIVLPWLILAPIELAVLFTSCGRRPGPSGPGPRDLLGPEVEAGVVDPELLTAVSGLRKDRTHYRKQLHSRRRAAHLIEGASDLAHEIATARGAETPRVEHARAELLRLRGS
ncbi:PrsW family glutamic-type intramembrane protease [Cryptosporangium minutisporangium]|uniref:PrsW family intramembrane metalloprotease n=1 Tax=Cryptosporangium minutisporangium TaxID=113569 RepID=A0ABP6ST85_9ACTN